MQTQSFGEFVTRFGLVLPLPHRVLIPPRAAVFDFDGVEVLVTLMSKRSTTFRC